MTSSYLSPCVRQLLRLSVEPCHDRKLNGQALQCLRKEGQVLVFEDHPVQCLLGNAIIDDYSARTKEWYKVVLRRLSPLFNFAHELLLKEPFDADLEKNEHLQWLTHPELVSEAIKLLQSRDDKCVTNEVLLLLTPMLERSLGNILFTTNDKLKVPALLRDLIHTRELYDCIGSPILMLLLHVMVGSPQGLNLRNLVWHGFPKPGELSPALASSLIILLFSIGEVLVNKDLIIEQRPSLDILGPRGLMAKVERIYSSIPYTVDELNDKLAKSIDKDNDGKSLLLHRVHKLLIKNKFRQSLFLLIPQWEHQARLLFAKVNQCPQSSSTAENDKLYLTFDEILSKIRTDPEDPEKTLDNALPEIIGDQHMEFLIDFLILPEGPRFRDKLSHGEIDLKTDLVNSVFRMCIYVIIASFSDLSRLLTNQSPSLLNEYQAIFHPKKLLFDELDEVLIQVENLTEHPSLYETSDFGPDDPLTKLRPRLQQCVDYICDEHYENYFQALRRYCSTIQLQTLYRPKYEYVITAMFRRLLAQIRATLEHSMENMDDKMLKYEADELNERQLATYARMLECVPRYT